jgi:uncharacterized protein (DUF305 family)
MTTRLVFFGALIIAGFTGTTMAQEPAPLPAICGVEAEHGGHAMGEAEPDPALDEAHAALVAGMDAMHRDMDAGSKAADIDVAFVCGMIPHHQGAIDMAKAVLAYGDDPWVKSLAEAIVAAQEQEIADMHAWLAQQPE